MDGRRGRTPKELFDELCVTDSSDAEKRFLPHLWWGFFLRDSDLWLSSQIPTEAANPAATLLQHNPIHVVRAEYHFAETAHGVLRLPTKR